MGARYRGPKGHQSQLLLFFILPSLVAVLVASSCVPIWEFMFLFKSSMILYLHLDQLRAQGERQGSEPAPATWTPSHTVLCTIRKSTKSNWCIRLQMGGKQACSLGELMHFRDVLSKAKVFNAKEGQFRIPPLLGHALNHILSAQCSHCLLSPL